MNTIERLVEKSKEAFIMAIEIYNKPTLLYRLEGFSFFICNAWELMLKAHLINKYGEFHGVDMTEIVPNNFLALSVRIENLNEVEIRAKYTSQVSEKLIEASRNIGALVDENNSNFAIRLDHYYYNTKDRNEATEFYHIDILNNEITFHFVIECAEFGPLKAAYFLSEFVRIILYD